MPTPSRFMNYSVRFETKRSGLKWEVMSIYPDNIERRVIRVWNRFTALRIEQALTQHYRNGWDMGAKGHAIFGGGRAA